MSEQHVLIVDDTPEIVQLLQLNLARHGYAITTAGTGAEALRVLKDGFHGIVILDLNLPDYRELELFHQVRKVNEGLPIIIITAYGTIDMAIEAIRLGAFDFLTKTEAFLERVYVSTKNAFRQLELHQRLAQMSEALHSRYSFDQIISVSDTMKPVFELMRHAVDSKVTVLVTGDSGTGKELIARALHYNSDRKDGPFVAVNCAGIPETLLESELFGFEKGAFTGAVQRKKGKFEVADHGTIFLDEIGEMPALLQSKLLRVLQEREIERLGGNTPIKLDVRVVCATNRDLRKEVAEGRFREDLYYRLAVFPIHLPQLRERSGDIPILARFFLKKAAKEENKGITGFASDALMLLTAYEYPGNVRELQNIIAHAVVVCDGDKVRARDLPHTLRGEDRRGVPVRRTPANFDALLEETIASPEQIPTMEHVEGRVIERAVDLCKGNLVQAAKRLGISRATIYRRIGKLNIRRD
ncbi:MAG: DNA-binding NtrC family response regulator [Myxococcota bacterium]|jgi:DNA-binding NtrC family response regulator